MRSAWLAPPIFLLHVLEEAPGFVAWFNRHVDVDLTFEGFVALNATGFLVTAALAALAATSPGRGPALGLLAWLGFLMLANGLLHIGATLYFGEYAPGAVTAALLYLPYFAWLFHALGTRLRIGPGTRAAAALAGAVPMLAQGYAVLVEGRRLLW